MFRRGERPESIRYALFANSSVFVPAALETALQNRLAPIRYEECLIRRALDHLIDEMLPTREAAEVGVSVEELERREIAAKVKPVGEEEVAAKYRELKQQLTRMSERDALKMLLESMTSTRLA